MDPSRLEILLMRRINRFRVNHGQDRLRRDNDLVVTGRRWGQEMNEANKVMHSGGEWMGRQLRPDSWEQMGENVGFARDESPSGRERTRREQVLKIFRMWKQSPDHRRNMLQADRRFGVGLMWRPGGGVYATQHMHKAGYNPTLR